MASGEQIFHNFCFFLTGKPAVSVCASQNACDSDAGREAHLSERLPGIVGNESKKTGGERGRGERTGSFTVLVRFWTEKNKFHLWRQSFFKIFFTPICRARKISLDLTFASIPFGTP